ncbi:hypothetical protein [Vagococcus intermedius]|uniref:Uncharacterized protein n=1 Tax=Vagococcus intermedius TaxID=2991418 RepID=A0AAF0CVC0_9ENTE|nr:hypothetical protein [Vagococcus intermedius]WEG73610.1 hypothetical protein OL234_01510 [Vagococcus intermedius]WEG75694.1 hypothetical protein OL235_01520 [Vagococcus intermedius]
MLLKIGQFEEFMTFDVMIDSKLGYVSRKMLFPINYSEKDVLLELNKKYPELRVIEVIEDHYTLLLK